MAQDKPRGTFVDLEAARRKRTREAEQRRYPGTPPREEETGEEQEIHFTWQDILAMIIAAYQILLPVVAVIIGALVVVYLIFRLVFH